VVSFLNNPKEDTTLLDKTLSQNSNYVNPLTSPLSEIYAHYTGQRPTSCGREKMFLAICHDDTEPSFSVNDDKDVAFCFSCVKGYNRHTLLKLLGVPQSQKPLNRCHTSCRVYGNGFPKAGGRRRSETLENALRQLGQTERANSIYNCGRLYAKWRCIVCGRETATPSHCHDNLCPNCHWQRVQGFLRRNQERLMFLHRPWVVDIHFPGKKLFGQDGKDPPSLARKILKEYRDEWQRIRRRWEPVKAFRRDLQCFQLRIEGGILWVTMTLLLDATDKDIALLKSIYAGRYHWKSVRLARVFGSKEAALEWFAERAARGFYEWKTPQDLECFLESTRGLPVVMSHGLKEQVKGGKGKGRRPASSQGPKCPYCGSTHLVRDGFVRAEDVIWENGFPEIKEKSTV